MRRFSGSGRGGPSTETSLRGSHEELLSGITVDKSPWSSSTGFLAASTAFSVSHHSLLLLPVAVIRHGGAAFLLLYSLLVVVLGVPLLLTEMFLGQYSSLSCTHLYYNLCPLLSGLGIAIYATVILRTVLNVSLVVWVSRALYDVFSLLRPASPGLERVSELTQERPSVEKMFALESTELITLAVVVVLLLLLSLGGVRGIGHVASLSVAASVLVLVTLVTRCCLAEGGWAGVTSLLAPDWSVLTRPHVWALAVTQLVVSTNLGTGVLSTFASNNSYSHNILRDVLLVTAAHLLWSTVATLLVSSLLGLTGVSPDTESLQSVLDCLVTAMAAMANLSQGWLWLGLLFILFIIVTLSNTVGYIALIVSIVPTCRRAISTPISLSVIFFLSLVLINKTGPAIFLVVSSGLTSWPPLLFCLLTVLLLTWAHGIRYLESDLTTITTILTPHIIICHLNTSLYTLTPLALAACLAWLLWSMAESSSSLVLLTTSLLPLLPIVLGAVVMTIRAARHYPRTVVSIVTQMSNMMHLHRLEF